MSRILAREHNLVVVDFGGVEVPLSKKQLAQQLNRSPRWIEMRMKEGMPAHWEVNERRFRLSEVKDWLAGRERKAADG